MRDNVQSKDSFSDDVANLELERVEALRQILESEQGKPITFEEAREIGESILRLFEAFAEEKQEVGTEEIMIEPQQLLLIK